LTKKIIKKTFSKKKEKKKERDMHREESYRDFPPHALVIAIIIIISKVKHRQTASCKLPAIT
jgi:hypothetical protein